MAKGVRKMISLPRSRFGDARFVIVFDDGTARAYQVDHSTRVMYKLTRRLPTKLVRDALEYRCVDLSDWPEDPE